MSSDEPLLPPYPRATIRLQFSSSFTFGAAAEIVPDLSRMGFSHVYASPILEARVGSTHGYDIVNHNQLNREFGGDAEFATLVSTLHDYGMGLIIDFVPNHMGVGYSDNAWWLNVLEWGQHSPYSEFFDIDWNSSEQTLKGKVLVPVLGEPYGIILESEQLRLAFDRRRGSFSVHYYEHRFPLHPRDYRVILEECTAELSHQGSLQQETAELAGAFRKLRAARSASAQAVVIQRGEELKRGLAALVERESEVGDALDRVCTTWNGTEGTPRSFDRLHKLLERQAYRLSYWRLAANEINYRRFFDINDLAAVRMERGEVFEITHQLVLRLVNEGAVQGIRLDHVDGLLDPRQYLERLQESAAYRLIGRGGPPFEPREAALDQPLYVVAEKILAHHEELRTDWATSGTTGYDHMAVVNEVLTDPAGEEPLTRVYEHFVQESRDFDRLVLDAKYRTMQETLASELNILANRMSRLAKRHRRTRDLSRLGLRRALMDIVANFPVYRSYVDKSGVSDADRRDIEWAVARARRAARTVDTTAYDFVLAVLTTDLLTQYPGQFRRREVVELAMKIQQFTAPVMAKSVEDTAYYRDVRFVARNEVGAEPERFFASVQGFHYSARARLERHPFAMVTTATHDHKRGEDVRARLAAISEVPGTWEEWTKRMAEYGEVFTTTRDEGPAPSLQDQYMLLQTIVGTWPFDLRGPEYEGIDEYHRRITNYAIKAAREAKLETSWTRPDEQYEDALERFIAAILNPKRSSTMLRVIAEMVDSVILPGTVNSLSQKLLTLTVPGVPDVYQGTDGWDFSLVDPDNRRPVDFTLRRQWLSAGTSHRGEPAQHCHRVLREWRTGEIKHTVVRRTLSLRKRRADLFAAGDYLPLTVEGAQADRILAFARLFRGTIALVVVPRLVAPLLHGSQLPLVPPERWEDTRIVVPDGPMERFINEFTGETSAVTALAEERTIAVSHILATFPVALLYGETGQ
ncbi:MAG: malto-oligosyltrehalose synthase [Alkalispirochaeta sp.]